MTQKFQLTVESAFLYIYIPWHSENGFGTVYINTYIHNVIIQNHFMWKRYLMDSKRQHIGFKKFRFNFFW